MLIVPQMPSVGQDESRKKLAALQRLATKGFCLFPVGLNRKPLCKWTSPGVATEKQILWARSQRTMSLDVWWRSLGTLGATHQLDLVSVWHEQVPWAGWAVALGHKSGFFVVDVDIRDDVNGAENLMRVVPLPRLPTVMAGTPRGGLHIYFAYPETWVPWTGNDRIARGVDLKADGGYVLVAPSFTHHGTYSWLEGASPQDLAPSPPPPAWIPFLKKVERPPPKLPPIEKRTADSDYNNAIVRNLATQSEPGRNARLFNAALNLSRQGLSQSEIEGLLVSACEQNGLLQSDRRGVYSTIQQGVRNGQA